MPASRRTIALAFSAALAGFSAASPAKAADLNWVELFRTQVLKCMHGTVNTEKAQIEVIKGPETAGEITTVRLKTYYDGMIRRNVMETDLIIRQSGSIRQMKINNLADSGTTLTHCDMEKTWRDF